MLVQMPYTAFRDAVPNHPIMWKDWAYFLYRVPKELT